MMQRRRWSLNWGPRGIRQADVRTGLRLTLVALGSMVLARALGLHSFYWAGISAILVSTGTPGGSFAASLARSGGTLVGVVVGFICARIMGHSLATAAVAIPLAILAAQVLGLKEAARVAALSTLFPVSMAQEATWTTSLLRLENVLVGSGVAFLADALLWPDRISRRLRTLLREDGGRAAALAAALIRGYRDGQVESHAPEVAALQESRARHRALMLELGREPEDPEAPREELAEQVEEIRRLVDQVAALHGIWTSSGEDRVQALLGAELSQLADLLERAGEAWSRGYPLGETQRMDLESCGTRFEAAYAAVRGERGTLAYPVQELFHLLTVLQLGASLAQGLARLTTMPDPVVNVEG